MNYINRPFYGHYHNRIRKGYSGHLNLDHSFSKNDRLVEFSMLIIKIISMILTGNESCLPIFYPRFISSCSVGKPNFSWGLSEFKYKTYFIFKKYEI